MQIKFPERHDKELEDIDSSLRRLILPDPKKLKKFAKQLKSIEKSLKSDDEEYHSSLNQLLKDQKTLIQKISGRCEQLEQRRIIINFAETAEALANSSPNTDPNDIISQAQTLKENIELFLKGHRPSQNNAKFIRFALACIDKALRQETVVHNAGKKNDNLISLSHYGKAKVTPESFVLAEFLYELSAILYSEKIEEFQKKFNSELSEGHKKELNFHIKTCKGDINKLKSRSEQIFIIQGLLGYAHILTDYFMDDTPYPTIVEIHNIFQDVDFVNHLDNH